MMKEMTGVLLFSKEQPQIQGYLIIDGEHFDIAGWHTSKIKAEITARRMGPAQPELPLDEPPCMEPTE
jgi:hypothetical protein